MPALRDNSKTNQQVSLGSEYPGPLQSSAFQMPSSSGAGGTKQKEPVTFTSDSLPFMNFSAKSSSLIVNGMWFFLVLFYVYHFTQVYVAVKTFYAQRMQVTIVALYCLSRGL